MAASSNSQPEIPSVKSRKNANWGGCIMHVRRFATATIAIFLLLSATAEAALYCKKVMYVGGTSIKEKTEGASSTNDEKAFGFDYKTGKLSIPYERVNDLGQKAGRRPGLSLTGFPWLLLSKKREHFFTVGYQDENENPTPYNDEFNGTTLNSKWVFTNQSGAIAAVQNGNLVFTCSNVNNTWTLLLETLPPAPWTFVSKLRLQGNRGSYASGGLCLLDSSTGHRCNFGVFGKGNIGSDNQAGGIEVQEWTNINTFSADAYADHAGIPESYLYYKIQNDGTNLMFSWSADGVIFSVVRVETLASFIANPDHIGFSTWSLSGNDPHPAVTFDLIVDWIRRTA